MKITNKLNLPSAFVNMAQSDYQPTPKQYSATTLLKPTRQIILERRYTNEIEQDVADMIWMLFGQAVHYILEHHDNSGWAEQKLKFTLENGYTISGIIDLYNEELQRVEDYKTCSTWKVIFKEYDDWEKQGLVYAWLLRKLGFPCKEAVFNAIMKDWVKGKAYKGDYPKMPIEVVKFKVTDKKIEEIDYFITKKIDELIEAEQLPDNELPLCTPEEMWRDPTKYAVVQYGKKRALKVTLDKEEAEEYLRTHKPKAWKIEERLGTPKRCFAYCLANQFCPFYKELMFGKATEEENEEEINE